MSERSRFIPTTDPNGNPLNAPAMAQAFPITELIGIRFKSRSDGHAVAELQSGPQHANPMGTLHGGVLCDLADAAMGVAFASTLGSNESFTTLELKINFLRPVWNAFLTAEAHVLSRGRTVGLVTCKIVDENGRLIANATSTCMVLTGDSARNR